MCTCPSFLGHILHRWPCPQAGEITDPPAPAPPGAPDGD